MRIHADVAKTDILRLISTPGGSSGGGFVDRYFEEFVGRFVEG